MKLARLALALSASVLAFAPAKADTADFYRGKSINLVVGYGPGGGYDIFARLLARWYGNHMPGKPNVIVQNVPGASSIVLSNVLYNKAPRDGTACPTSCRPGACWYPS